MAGADPAAAAKARLRRTLLAARADRSARSGPGGAGPAGTRGDAGPRTGLVLALPEIAAARCVAAYVSLAAEPPTGPLLGALRERGVRVLLPAVGPDRNLTFREFTGDLVAGRLGTREPPPRAGADELDAVDVTVADVVVVPAVAVDRAGRRLGRGGGSYDRALARIRPGAVVVALLDEVDLVDEVPVEAHDRPVDIVVTERRVIRTWAGGPPGSAAG